MVLNPTRVWRAGYRHICISFENYYWTLVLSFSCLGKVLHIFNLSQIITDLKLSTQQQRKTVELKNWLSLSGGKETLTTPFSVSEVMYLCLRHFIYPVLPEAEQHICETLKTESWAYFAPWPVFSSVWPSVIVFLLLQLLFLNKDILFLNDFISHASDYLKVTLYKLPFW